MSTGFFEVLRDDDDDSSEGDESTEEEAKAPTGDGLRSLPKPSPPPSAAVHVPSYEDLSSVRADEVTVLEAVYGPDDFAEARGAWGLPLFTIRVRPPDVEPARAGSSLALAVQLARQYPYVPPSIELRDVRGLSSSESSELLSLLRSRARDLAESGSVMIVELVQVAEDYLLSHNVDPTMSAWELEEARVAAKREEARKLEEEMARLMMSGGRGGGGADGSSASSRLPSPRNDGSLLPASASAAAVAGASSRVTFRDDSDVRIVDKSGHRAAIERELQRQQAAFASVRKLRADASTTAAAPPNRETAGGGPDEPGEEIDEDGEDAEFELDDGEGLAVSGSSRYKSDFIELGVLGRGGGGEVVKVRNRLDRRIYAVKKIVLEPEEGRFAKYGAVQNRKLRREVTTISRMTHKNIVRYYQAWVEGGAGGSSAPRAANDEDAGDPKGEKPKESSSDSSGSDVEGSWWTSSPLDRDLPAQMQAGAREPRVASSFDDFDDRSQTSDDPVGSSSTRVKSLHSDSMVNLLEHENDHDFGNPLLHGLGFQNQIYDAALQTDLNVSAETDANDWEESSTRVDSTSGRAILYIQMEYCATTLRKLIDDGDCATMQENDVWRLIRQILEALVYIHSRNIIHRDLKPGNLFIDADGNVRLGDFGLATTHRDRSGAGDAELDNSKELDAAPEVFEFDHPDRTVGHEASAETYVRSASHTLTGGESMSMTGGVGTTFYIAPEQEGVRSGSRNESVSYSPKADIFSLGVILFEIFHPPFTTYMERAETLTTLRGDRDSVSGSMMPKEGWIESDRNEFERVARTRLPTSFVESVPENAQRMVLWCMERNATNRPTAEDLLASELLPRKIELEKHYLDEAMEILITSSQSESYLHIVDAIFGRSNPDLVEFTFDTDIAARSNFLLSGNVAEELLRSIGAIRAGAIDMSALSSLAMSSSSIAACTASFKRSRYAGRLGKGGKAMLKRSTQRTAGILAMRAATAAAVTGSLDGVLGADPLVVDRVIELCKGVFHTHGAVCLRSPLLRPRTNSTTSSVGGPAELINSRGVVLLLPEDLTAPFARAIGRGGSAASNLKRYDIGRVFHKSMADGHPRETLEASFDVVQEDASLAYISEAETVIVASQVLAILPKRTLSVFRFETRSPMWYLRVNHTRLADALLDLCGVPAKEVTRRACLQILSRFTAPPPLCLRSLIAIKRKTGNRRSSSDAGAVPDLTSILATAVSEHGLPKFSAERFRQFLEMCMPLPIDLGYAVEVLKKAFASLQTSDVKEDPRRMKRFEEAARSLRNMKDVFSVLQALGFEPLVSPQGPGGADRVASVNAPLFVSLDLGLRQRRKHYHGGFIFQCVVLPDDFFDELDPAETNESLIGPSGRGCKVAEGGNFSDLVRKHRPPGNFGPAFVNYYTAAPIPSCAGVRISIGRLVELLYLDASSEVQRSTLDGWNELLQRSTIDHQGLEVLRRSLGHPLRYAESVQCVVTSVHGIDSASTKERFLVASRLWREGISAEYLPQSGVMLSLLKRLRDDSTDGGASDWSLTELVGVCALLKIPFLVIVQPHLLRDKNSVRLRRYPYDVISQGGATASASTNEAFVSLDVLASTILTDTAPDEAADEPVEASSSRDAGRSHVRENRPLPCILVEHDQYYGNDREMYKSEVPQWKAYLKAMKSISLSAQAYLGSLQGSYGAGAQSGGGAAATSGQSGGAPSSPPMTPVFAVADASFFVLRDFGTCLMRREGAERSAAGAATEAIERYPKHKRVLRTLGTAIDGFMRRQGYWSYSGSASASTSHALAQPSLIASSGGTSRQNQPSVHGSSLVTLLLYSKVDDRFDLVTLSSAASRNGGHPKRAGK